MSYKIILTLNKHARFECYNSYECMTFGILENKKLILKDLIDWNGKYVSEPLINAKEKIALSHPHTFGHVMSNRYGPIY